MAMAIIAWFFIGIIDDDDFSSQCFLFLFCGAYFPDVGVSGIFVGKKILVWVVVARVIDVLFHCG